jgi:hypothetical protein
VAQAFGEFRSAILRATLICEHAASDAIKPREWVRRHTIDPTPRDEKCLRYYVVYGVPGCTTSDVRGDGGRAVVPQLIECLAAGAHTSIMSSYNRNVSHHLRSRQSLVRQPRPVREAKFVRCSVANEDPPIDRDCWAVSLAPNELFSHGPPGTKLRPASYLLVLVDPLTSKVMLAQGGAPGE